MVTESGAKVTFLLEQGKSDVLGANRANKAVIPHFNLTAESAIPGWKGGKTIPAKHIPTLAALFHFSADWPEWATGTAAAFEARYRREVLGETDNPEHLAQQVERGFAPKIALAGHNRQQVLRAMVERAAACIRGDAEFCDGLSPETVAREIVRLQKAFSDLDRPAATVELALPAELKALIASLKARCGGVLPEGEIDGEFLRMLELAHEKAAQLLQEEQEPDFRVALEGLKLTLEDALRGGTLDLGWLGDEVSHVERQELRLYRSGARALRRAVGLRLDVVPRPAIFTDGLEDWMPEMIALPLGSFRMGSPDSDPEAHRDEKPQHPVEIAAPVALARYPLTFDEYDAFCAATQREKPKDRFGRGRMPAIYVSWEDARAYCDWLAARSGAAYRLPSEAEWEYACRAGTEHRYWWGDDWDPARANGDQAIDRTTEVGSYDPNDWGLYDTHGNVWEWCEGRYEVGYETPRTQQAFTANGESDRVFRGGSWDDDAWFCRSAYRNGSAPGIRAVNLGFRPARGQAGSSGRQAAEPPED